MDLGLNGKGVIVLASSSGLGKAAALEFAREGANVMLFSSNKDKLTNAAEEIRSKTNQDVLYTVGDIKDPQDIKRVVKNAIDQFGRVDVLVNNTGGPPAGTFLNFDDEDWQNAYNLTLLSFIRAIREVIPHMKSQGGGRIINCTSSSVKRVLDNLILSNTFRMGVVGLTKSLSQELAKDNILVNVIAPGRIATDRTKYLDNVKAEKSGVTTEEVEKQSAASIPLGRYGDPSEFAKTLVFLCSEANTYVTGQTVLVDGGLVKAF
jgi:3-oxoacyl-[acyl-carrier protein] reductase